MEYISKHLKETEEIVKLISIHKIKEMIDLILKVKEEKGRMFFLGVGGSAANASHAVNDFRKLAGIESYSPTDNVAEVTARTNDEGWESVFAAWLKGSNLNQKDCLFVLSVGGGNLEKKVSVNICNAIDYAREKGSKIISIVGREGGHAQLFSDVSLLIPIVNADSITPHSESFQAIIWHLLVSHPLLKQNSTKW